MQTGEESIWFIWVTWSFALSGQSAFCYGCFDYQSIKVTTTELVGDTEIHVKHSTVYDVPLQDFMSFDVKFCFSPDCEDIEHKRESPMIPLKPEEGKGGNNDFTFKPQCEVVKPAQEEELVTLMDQPKQEEKQWAILSPALSRSLCLISSPTIPLPPKLRSLPSRSYIFLS